MRIEVGSHSVSSIMYAELIRQRSGYVVSDKRHVVRLDRLASVSHHNSGVMQND